MMASEYHIAISGSAPNLYPTDTFFGLLYYERDEALEIPKKYPYQGEWGQVLSTHLLNREYYPIPGLLDMVWLSVVERKFYSIIHKLPVENMEELLGQIDDENQKPLFDHIVVGMAPYGGVALWTYGFRKSVLVDWMQAKETQVDMKDFMPLNPSVNLDKNCDFYIKNDPCVRANLEKNGLPPRDLFDRYMQQFTYRYAVKFGHWDEEKKEWKEYEESEVRPEFDYIEEALFDGTHDKLHGGGLMEYHSAGKPKKLALQWHIKKSDYSAYLWFDDIKIRDAFERFYIQNPDAKMDFSIHIDPEKNKYQIVLKCAAAEEPITIEEETYQIIVFKSKFECFRSMNYNQPRGAWIW